MIVFKHEDCLLKDNGFNHPERKERIESILESIEKITYNLEKFHYNVIIANVYESYNFFNDILYHVRCFIWLC